jgi:DNA end-binding protein Ku
MLEAKLAGEEIAKPEPVTETPVIDLMEALRASVAQAGKKKEPAAAKTTAKSGRRPAKAAAGSKKR